MKIVLALLCSLLVIGCHIGFGESAPNVTEIILSYGYPCLNYAALTPDGYYLSLQRIPHGISNNKSSKGVVFFQHGLTDCSVGICLNPPRESLPFILADAGYDVWLGNNRGNGYSMSNTQYTPSDIQFWNFTYDAMAQYDLPTNINYVLKSTGASKLSYIGHSQGTIQAFAGLISNPSLAQKLNIFIAMAPVAYVYHTGSFLLKVLAEFDTVTILEYLGDHEFYLPSAIHQFLPFICDVDPTLCEFDLNVLMGPSNNLNITRLPFYLSEEPNPTSVLNLVHWSQGVDANVFQKFDYGTEGNMEHYGQPTPPPYELKNFPSSLPLALFTGSQDYLADPADVATLISQLPTPPVLVHNEPTYAHMDFLWATDAPVLIYPRILSLLAKYAA